MPNRYRYPLVLLTLRSNKPLSLLIGQLEVGTELALERSDGTVWVQFNLIGLSAN